MPTPKAPVHIDTTKASIARVYDAFLNGKDNYEVDREVFRRVKSVAPEAATSLRMPVNGDTSRAAIINAALTKANILRREFLFDEKLILFIPSDPRPRR